MAIIVRPDTRKLLTTGLSVFAIGAVAVALIHLFFGGLTKQGPVTNAGWLLLMLAMGCLPTGTLTLLLAGAKLLGDRNR